MLSPRSLCFREPFLRLIGAILLLLGAAEMRWLFGAARSGGPVDPSPVQYAAAATGFLGLSLGTALAMLGVHVFDQVELSDRWRRQTNAPRRETHNMAADLHLIEHELGRAKACSFPLASEDLLGKHNVLS